MKMRNVKLYKTTENVFLPNEKTLVGTFDDCEMYEGERSVFLEIANKDDLKPSDSSIHIEDPTILEITTCQGKTKTIRTRKRLTDISSDLIKIEFTVL
ncbi:MULTISPECIES: hypothetical protein [Bacillus]|uniref:hypothetical protein n=1 Tax=Bacillus TaxID=1386 RepID=UPI00099B943E|nr:MULTISPECIES: hypothetical protein [Bacillus amyloliquefaciens group]ASZ03872.1 hypothetical protein CJP14_08355 [Bacillus velezensis]AVB11526.1 hypothetical protein C3438_19570 [Bacillus velezensis]MCB5334893.1 hypothetical protein [Bacillus amyloliquefaciens]OPD42321.1 hypothetical protein BVF98_14595 [Bacillus amyloliquefaciens]QDK90315.1 hypothetical protein CXB71_10725 [Bacillus velezensis]